MRGMRGGIIKHGGYRHAGGWTRPCPDSRCARSPPHAPGQSAVHAEAPARAGCRRATSPTWRRAPRAAAAGRAARAASTAAQGAAAHANARAASRARAAGVCGAAAGDRVQVRGREEVPGTSGRACAGAARPRKVAAAAATVESGRRQPWCGGSGVAAAAGSGSA